jgi:hypothetical protein
MDKGAQQKLVGLILLMFVSLLNCSSQCSDSIKVKVTPDSCYRVDMSIDRFDEMYQAKTRLDFIDKHALPEAEKRLDSLIALQKEQDKDYQAQVKAANSRISVVEQGRSKLHQRLVEVEIDNMKKETKIERLKKSAPVKIGGGTLIGALMGLIFSSFFN